MKYSNKLVYKEAQNNMMHYENNLELGVKNGSVVKGFVEDFSEYKNQYFTIEALEDGSVGIVTISSGNINTGTYATGFTYSLDGGATWTTNNNATFQIPVTKGQKVLWQRNAVWPTPSSTYRYPYNEANQYIGGGSISSGEHWWQNRCSFHCTCKYKVYGNISTVATGSTYFAMFCEQPKSVNISVDIHPYDVNIPGGDPLPIKADADCVDEYEMHKLVDAYGLYIESATAVFAAMFDNCQRLENGPYFEKFSVGFEQDKLISGLSFYDVNTNYQFDSTFANCYSLKKCRIRMQNVVNSNKTIYSTFFNCLSMKYGPTYISGHEENGSRLYFYIWTAPYTNTFYNCQSLLSVFLDGTFLTDTIDGTLYLSVTSSNNYQGFLCGCKSLKMATFWYTKVNVQPQIHTVRWDDYVSSRTTIKGNLFD